MSRAVHPHSFVLSWQKPVTFNALALEWQAASAVGSAYSLEYRDGNTWKLACEVQGNRLPKPAHERYMTNQAADAHAAA